MVKMATISVPPLSPFVFTTKIGEAGKQPLNTSAPQKFRGLRGVFKITVTRASPSPPYYFSFVMKGGTGKYRTDPGRPFFYLQQTAVDNHLNYLESVFEPNTTYNTLKIKTKEPRLLGPWGAVASVTAGGMVTGVGTEFETGGPGAAVQPGNNIYIVSAAPGNPVSFMTVVTVDSNTQLQCTPTTAIGASDAGQIFLDDSVLYVFTFPVSISQWSFPTIQRIGNQTNKIEGPVTVRVENYAINYI